MKRKFIPPTLSEVEAYCKDKDLMHVKPITFLEYFTKADWIDSNNKPVKNWKNKAIQWNMGNREKKQFHNDFERRTKIIEAEKKIYNKPLTGTLFDGIMSHSIFKIPAEPKRKPMYEQVKELQQKPTPLTPEQAAERQKRIREQLEMIKAGKI